MNVSNGAASGSRAYTGQAYRHSRKHRSQAVGLAARLRCARLSSLGCCVSPVWTGLNWVQVSSGKGSNRSSSGETVGHRDTQRASPASQERTMVRLPYQSQEPIPKVSTHIFHLLSSKTDPVELKQ